MKDEFCITSNVSGRIFLYVLNVSVKHCVFPLCTFCSVFFLPHGEHNLRMLYLINERASVAMWVTTELKSQWDLTMAEQVTPGRLTTKARVLVSGESAWDLWRTEWHGDSFFFWVLWLSSVSTLPPTVHTHSLKYRLCLIRFVTDCVFKQHS